MQPHSPNWPDPLQRIKGQRLHFYGRLSTWQDSGGLIFLTALGYLQNSKIEVSHAKKQLCPAI